MRTRLRRRGLRLGLLGLTLGSVILTVLVGSAAAAPACSDGTCTETFGFTGTAQSWTVPAGVTSATFEVSGASGGMNNLDLAGLGGDVTATLAVSPGATYQVMVGGAGGDISTIDPVAGGFNGGGASGGGRTGAAGDGIGGGGGGGASDIRSGTCAGTLTCSIADRKIVAGGGGGSVFGNDFFNGRGGDGGHPSGSSGDARGAGTYDAGGGGGGSDSAGGSGGSGGSFGGFDEGDFGGSGALPTQDQGGSGGTGAFGLPDSVGGHGGGGGGGGYYGGGGGGGGSATGRGGGGGGGSSFVSADLSATNVSFNGLDSGDGSVTITYADPNPQYQILAPMSPLPKSKWKIGASIPVKFALAVNGTLISHTEAADLASACRVTVALDALAAGCATYDMVLHQFQFNWKVAKNTAVGLHSINITVFEADQTTVNAQFGIPINLKK